MVTKAFARISALIVVVCVQGASERLALGSDDVKVEQQERMTLSAAGIEGLAVETHNGAVTVSASETDANEISVLVTKVARGKSREIADAAMEAIQVMSEQTGSTQKLAWKWSTPRESDWHVTVSFDIQLPAEMSVDLSTHNGAITVTGVDGDCSVETHNGRVELDTAAASIHATTHNGTIDVTFHGAQGVAGSLNTHNGAITVAMGDDGAANFDCRWHNGGIRSSLDLVGVDRAKRSLKGSYGDAAGELHIETHNGAITLK